MEPSPLVLRPKILVADRLPRVVRMLRNVLEQAGYAAVTATGYAKAVAASHAERPDFILIELMMPDTPLYLEGGQEALPPPAPRRRLPPVSRQSPRGDEEQSPIERRLYPRAYIDDLVARDRRRHASNDTPAPAPAFGVPPYPIDAYIRALQYDPEIGAPPVVLTLDRASLLPYWSWDGIVIDAPPFPYITRPFMPSELLALIRQTLPGANL